MKKVISTLAATSVVALPAVALADTAANPLANLVTGLTNLAPDLFNLALVVAGLAFVYSLTVFIIKGDKEQGKTVMIWGLGALFIMFSFYGIIDLLQGMIFPGGVGTPDAPALPASGTTAN